MLITVFTTYLPQDAYMVQSYLESYEINTVLCDEYMAQVNNFNSNAVGGVKLQVNEADVPRAIEVLKRGGYISDADLSPAEPNIEYVEKTARRECPFCGSENIGKNKQAGIAAVVLYFIFGAFFPIFRSHHLCYDCGKHWRYNKH